MRRLCPCLRAGAHDSGRQAVLRRRYRQTQPRQRAARSLLRAAEPVHARRGRRMAHAHTAAQRHPCRRQSTEKRRRRARQRPEGAARLRPARQPAHRLLLGQFMDDSAEPPDRIGGLQDRRHDAGWNRGDMGAVHSPELAALGDRGHAGYEDRHRTSSARSGLGGARSSLRPSSHSNFCRAGSRSGAGVAFWPAGTRGPATRRLCRHNACRAASR